MRSLKIVEIPLSVNMMTIFFSIKKILGYFRKGEPRILIGKGKWGPQCGGSFETYSGQKRKVVNLPLSVATKWFIGGDQHMPGCMRMESVYCCLLLSMGNRASTWVATPHEMLQVRELTLRLIFGSSCTHQTKQTHHLDKPLRTDSPLSQIISMLCYPRMPWYSKMWWLRNELEEMKMPINTVISLHSSGHREITSPANPQSPARSEMLPRAAAVLLKTRLWVTTAFPTL